MSPRHHAHGKNNLDQISPTSQNEEKGVNVDRISIESSVWLSGLTECTSRCMKKEVFVDDRKLHFLFIEEGRFKTIQVQ